MVDRKLISDFNTTRKNWLLEIPIWKSIDKHSSQIPTIKTVYEWTKHIKNKWWKKTSTIQSNKTKFTRRIQVKRITSPLYLVSLDCTNVSWILFISLRRNIIAFLSFSFRFFWQYRCCCGLCKHFMFTIKIPLKENWVHAVILCRDCPHSSMSLNSISTVCANTYLNDITKLLMFQMVEKLDRYRMQSDLLYTHMLYGIWFFSIC